MTKTPLLIISLAACLLISGCSKDVPQRKITYADEVLPGDTLVKGKSNAYMKLFVLNEGQMGQENATLDFFKFSSGAYVRNAYSAMNPYSDGLGDVANNIRFYYDYAFIPVTNSNLVEVISCYDETHITKFEIPGPRDVTFDETRAYVTSYDGARYSNDKLGAVYRINLETKPVKIDTIHVGYQPEGIAINGQSLFVANSGGYHPGFDDRLDIVNTYYFKKSTSIKVAPNLQDVYADDENVWITSYGDYSTVHSGIYCYSLIYGHVLDRSEELKKVRFLCSCADQADVFVLGTEQEWNVAVKKTYKLYSVNRREGYVTEYDLDLSSLTSPYAICFNSSDGDIYVSDAGDYYTGGMIYCYNLDSGKLQWKTHTGVCPGSLALFGAIY